SSPTEIIPRFSSGTFTWVTDAGVSTSNGSGCLAVAVNIKNVSSRKDTSHMAVMSIVVLALLTFALGITLSFNYYLLIRCIAIRLSIKPDEKIAICGLPRRFVQWKSQPHQ